MNENNRSAGHTRLVLWPLLAVLAALAGCRPPPDPAALPPGDPADVFATRFLDPALAGDTVTLAQAPPPISGGTLAVAGSTVVASDPDRDRIMVVDLPSGTAREIALPNASDPGRVMLDPSGHAHVVLRGASAIYTFSLEAPADGALRPVCGEPRGIAYDAAADVIHVACRGGELMTLPITGDAILSSVRVPGGDLRDVVMRGDQIWVSRFRAAELIRVELDGAVMQTSAPTSTPDPFTGSFDPTTGAFRETVFRPAVAWRTISMPSGDVAMVHQRASDADLLTAPGAYYSSGLCDGSIVQSAVTFFGQDGSVSDAVNLMGGSLMLDVAVSQSGLVAVVNAGNQSGQDAVQVYPTESLTGGRGCAFVESSVTLPAELARNPIAVAWVTDRTLIVQQREPSRLVVVDVERGVNVGEHVISFGGESRFDTGHSLFHGNASRGTACASCHPEGGDDGRTWTFVDIGPRRTPAMHGGVMQTAPFHWDGDLADLGALMNTVFTGRMSGPRLVPSQVGAMGEWLDELRPPTASEPADRGSVDRGAALFFGEAQCASCHTGAMFTDNRTVDVGTGGAFQVPSLIGVSFRLPVMHDGCATTLEERFRPACGGGDMHGRTVHLSPEQAGDLVAYLETL